MQVPLSAGHRVPAEGPLRLLYPLLQSIARRLDRLRPQIPRGVCVLVSDEQVCCRPAQHRLIITARHNTTHRPMILLTWDVRVAILAFLLHCNHTRKHFHSWNIYKFQCRTKRYYVEELSKVYCTLRLSFSDSLITFSMCANCLSYKNDML